MEAPLTLWRNARLATCVGAGLGVVERGALVTRGGRIAYAGPVARAPALPPDVQRIDARGGSILPGLVEAHFHATYFDVAALEDLDIKYPVEYVTLLAAANAKLALECGLRYIDARINRYFQRLSECLAVDRETYFVCAGNGQ